MNWRLEIKSVIEQKVVEALGDVIRRFGPWNSQTINNDTEETLPYVSVFFEYSAIGDGLEYTLDFNSTQVERVPVEMTLHVVFNTYNDDYQNCAYDYAEKITIAIAGTKNEFIHGRITKIGENEDINHAAQYDYQIVFAFQVKEAVFNDIIDGNPETETNPFPETGRTLTPSITVQLRDSITP